MRVLFTVFCLGALAGCGLLSRSDLAAAKKVCKLQEECPEGNGDNAEVCAAEAEIALEFLDGTACELSQLDLTRCLARLNCDEFDDYFLEPVENYPCFEADLRVAADCR